MAGPYLLPLFLGGTLAMLAYPFFQRLRARRWGPRLAAVSGSERPATRAEALLEQAMSLVRHRSQAAGIDAPFVATRAEVRGLMADGPAALPEQHRLLRGWRRGVVGEELLALMTDGRHPR